MSESKSTTKTPNRGRKPKVVSVAAGTNITAIADIEGDQAGDPVVAGEKVKPLLVKISKAELSALTKLFSFDEAGLPDKDIAKRRLQLKALIKLGKTSGHLTHAEISDRLPGKLVGVETLDTIISALNDMGVAVYEQPPAFDDPWKMEITYKSHSNG